MNQKKEKGRCQVEKKNRKEKKKTKNLKKNQRGTSLDQNVN